MVWNRAASSLEAPATPLLSNLGCEVELFSWRPIITYYTWITMSITSSIAVRIGHFPSSLHVCKSRDFTLSVDRINDWSYRNHRHLLLRSWKALTNQNLNSFCSACTVLGICFYLHCTNAYCRGEKFPFVITPVTLTWVTQQRILKQLAGIWVITKLMLCSACRRY